VIPAAIDMSGPKTKQTRSARSRRETMRLTRSSANVRRLRAAHAEIEAHLARRRSQNH